MISAVNGFVPGDSVRIPYLGAWTAGFFAVGLALSTGSTETAVAVAVIAFLANGLLQQIVQPIAYGATLGLNTSSS